MVIVRTMEQLREALGPMRASGDRIAFVPTMGNLHAGHMALVEEARRQGDRVVVSLFVNPAQFGPEEDYDAYPRTWEADRERLLAAGGDVLLAPTVEAVYPDGVGAVTVMVDEVTEGLCAATRPGFFTGVATVVTKLLCAVQPDVAVFGRKDYQQLVTIRRLVRNLHLPVAVEGAPIVREADGLAVSSRNNYLDAVQRRTAAGLYRALQEAIRSGDSPDAVAAEAHRQITANGLEPEYAEVRRGGDLAAVTDLNGPRVLLAAAHVGGTRLIDNLEFGPEAGDG